MRYSLIIAIFLISFSCFGQYDPSYSCSFSKRPVLPELKTTTSSSIDDKYDIHYIKFELYVTNSSSFITGKVSTFSKVLTEDVSKYQFELADTLKIDSIIINGILHPYQRVGYLCEVPLLLSTSKGSDLNVTVYYHGVCVAGFRSVEMHFFNGEKHFISYTHSEPYNSREWWPCKQSLIDKIDSIDMNVMVPDTITVGSNGILTNSSVTNGIKKYEWKERYPIDYYLISIACAPYSEHSYYMHFSNSNDSMLIQNFLIGPLLAFPEIMDPIDSTGIILDHFSTKLGRYPFWREKYGHCSSQSQGGAMEHQTMTTLDFYDTRIIAHEIFHQWFGNYVTCGSWSDIWINEGFASYGEYIFAQGLQSDAIAKTAITTKQTNALSIDTGSVYVYNTTNRGRIFSSILTYNKGASVVHMLRSIANNDELFFYFLRRFLEKHAYKNATTENLKEVAEEVFNQNLDDFFDQWIYKEGYPVYKTSWNQVGNVLYINVGQTTMSRNVLTFKMPIDIKLFSANGDSTVRVYNDKNSQLFQFITNNKIDSIKIDPFNWILCKKEQPIKDVTINKLTDDISFYPNPSHDQVFVSYKNLNNGYLTIYDMAGKIVVQEKLIITGINPIDLRYLVPGDYLYSIFENGKCKVNGKLSKL